MTLRKQIPLRMNPALFEQIAERAKERNLSINEWCNRALISALASKADKIRVTETKEYTL